MYNGLSALMFNSAQKSRWNVFRMPEQSCSDTKSAYGDSDNLDWYINEVISLRISNVQV